MTSQAYYLIMTILALLVQRPHGARLASELEKAEEGLRLSRVQDPTLRWTPEAQFIVDKAMRALQEPDGDCEGEGRKFLAINLVTPPDPDVRPLGLMARVHQFLEAGILALHLQRTLINPIPGSEWNLYESAPNKCGALFDRFMYRYLTISKFHPLLRSPGDGKEYVMHFKSGCEGCPESGHVWDDSRYVVLYLYEGRKERWPTWLWKQVVEAGAISVYDPKNEETKVVDGFPWPKSMSENEIESEKSFMLRALLVRYFLKPSDQVLKQMEHIRAHRVSGCTESAYLQKPQPYVSVHVRRTDKTVEDPYWYAHREYRSLDNIAEMTHEKVKQGDALGEPSEWSVFLMSDSNSVAQSFNQSMNNLHETASPNTCPSSLFTDDYRIPIGDKAHRLNRFVKGKKKTKELDHSYIPDNLKEIYQQHFYAQTLLAAEATSMIVTMSSNVGRFLFEYAGALVGMAQTSQTDGPLGLSLDCSYYIGSNHCCHASFKPKEMSTCISEWVEKHGSLMDAVDGLYNKP